MPGGCSDAPCIRHPDYRLLPAGSLQNGEKSIRYPAVTISWVDWLLEKGEPDSNWYDFAEERIDAALERYTVKAGQKTLENWF